MLKWALVLFLVWTAVPILVNAVVDAPAWPETSRLVETSIEAGYLSIGGWVLLMVVMLASSPETGVSGRQAIALVVVSVVLVALASGSAGNLSRQAQVGKPPPPSAIERVDRTTVVSIIDGEITYIVQRKAAGQDTVGYGDADFITITVDKSGKCYQEAELINELPRSCDLEVR